MPKQITFDETARRALERGIDQLADAVKITLGPRGRHVVLERKYGGPAVTNDGVTIAREIELSDPFENIGAQLAKTVATKTNDVAGDGTTTATVLAQAMVREGLRNVAAGANPMALGRGIAAGADAVANALAAKATPVAGEQAIAQVATVSSRDPKIGTLVGEAMTRVGRDGVITVEESSTLATELEFTEGIAFDKGYISPYFITDAERMETVLQDAYVLLHREKISSLQDLLPLLEKVSEAGKPLLIVAEDVEGEALSTLVVNAIRRTLSVVAVKAPFFGDRRRAFLEDLAVVTGGRVVDPEVGLKLAEVGLEVLGRARRIVVTKDETTIVEGAGKPEDIQARAAQLRREIEESDSDWDREKLQERLAKLAGAVGVIKVGAATEVELKERKARIEDAVAAARAASEEGIIPGGGAALIHIAKELDDLGLHGDEATGVAIVRTACAAPTHWIAANSGQEGAVVAAKVRELPWGHGFDAEAQSYRDLVAAGVIDPVKVTRAAIVNAASIARMVITTESAVADKPEKKAAANHDHGHGHGHEHGL
jgi:chaperonin GroEL